MEREREEDAADAAGEPQLEPAEAAGAGEDQPPVSGEAASVASPEGQAASLEGPAASEDKPPPQGRRRFRVAVLAAACAVLAIASFLLGFAVRAATEDDLGPLQESVRSLDERTGNIEETLRSMAGAAAQKGDPTIPMTADDDDPAWGPDDAGVTVEQFADFQCPFCGRFATQTLPALRQQYEDRVRFVFRDFPLSMHQYARKASEAAQCAQDQGRFWQYHDLLFANQSALAPDQLKQYAAQAGLDTAKFNDCLDSGKNAQEVALDLQEGERAGVTGTPAFIVNGKMIAGAQPLEQFQVAIDQALAAAH
jgi:protein-disulfide isomerase